jgi:hypothetical protein
MLAACLAPAAHADEWTKLTYFTFSAPVELPGIVLPAGTYKFELADPDSSRRVVRVSDKEGPKVHGTFLSIPNEMMQPAEKPLVMFKEAPAGAPEAVKAWFYPGEATGFEFVYPHDQALKIAKAIHAPVLTAKGEVTGTTMASETTRTTASRARRPRQLPPRRRPPRSRQLRRQQPRSKRRRRPRLRPRQRRAQPPPRRRRPPPRRSLLRRRRPRRPRRLRPRRPLNRLRPLRRSR